MRRSEIERQPKSRLAAVSSARCYTTHPKTLHKILHQGGIEVDLIPFGGVERADGSIAWPPAGDFVMSVLGFREAKACAIDVGLPNNQRIEMVSLPMLAALKVLAWSDRRTREPRKDAADLVLILRSYLDAGQADRIYREAPQLLDLGGFDYEQAGAWLAGHDVADRIRRHSAAPERLKERLRSALAPEVDPDGPLHLVGEIADFTADRLLMLLAAFLAGIDGEGHP